ncbi:hypothetical protein ANN_23759 [Periplaneta americana]|uniref:PHD-type domain-containing protein n=1 Tax=Periplaneta americana TaxID=6978 RepID=A0ABQ8SMG6_PERAM|nr:hypothetical protein ANN_23759 [Periplaneta americana]
MTISKEAVGCDGCPLWFHSTCTPLGVTEAKALNSKKGNLLWMCDTCRYRLQTYGLNKTSTEADDLITDSKKSYEELKQKMDEVSETLMQKMSLLLETQLHQTEILTSIIEKPETNSAGREQAGSDVERNKQPRPSVIKEQRQYQHDKEDTETNNDRPETNEQSLYIEGSRRQYADAVNIAPRNKRQNTTTIGTMDPSNTDLQAGERRAWLYVGKLHPNTTTEKIKNHLQKQGIETGIECDELTTKGTLKAFRIAVPFERRSQVTTPEFWPQGVLVRQYRFRNGRTEGAILE